MYILSISKNFFLSERKSRVKYLIKLISDNPKLPINKIKGLFTLKTGCSFKVINEYLAELTESGLIEFDEELRTYKVLV